MCVCIRVCDLQKIYVCVRVYMHMYVSPKNLRVRTCVRIYVYTGVYIRPKIRTCIRTHVCTHIDLDLGLFSCTYMCAHVSIVLSGYFCVRVRVGRVRVGVCV